MVDVAAKVITASRRMLAWHWLRVSMTISELTPTPPWLAGRDPAITAETGSAKWRVRSRASSHHSVEQTLERPAPAPE